MLLQAPIKHRNFETAIGVAHASATNAPPGTVIFVTGPSGAGKSTLKRHLSKSLFGPPEAWTDSRVLLASVRATNSETGYFSSKDFFSRLLTTLGDPFRGSASDVARAAIATGDNAEIFQFLADPLWRSIRVAMTETKIRRAFECLGAALGLKAILIDEAQSMCLTHVNRNPSDHLESLKCLAEELGILIFLFGTYDLLEIWNHSAQLNRRTRLIHIARYDPAVDSDRDAFFAILNQLGKVLDLDHAGILGAHAEEIFTSTMGVFGELEGLLERARDLALSEGSKKIAWRHIEATMYNPAQLKRLRNEIAVGEARIRGEILTVSSKNNTRPGSKGVGRRPGRRNPVRDACGPKS